tara:strand:- start:697 stop:1824 length:1128 start_codon:yes stop_codon:yes gene_type:complete
LIKVLIRKITKPDHRDYVRFKLIKIKIYCKLCKILKNLIITNKKLIAYLINEKNLKKRIKISYLIFEYQRLYGNFKNITKTRNFYLKLISKKEVCENNINEIISAKIELGKFKGLRDIISINTNKKKKINQMVLLDFFENKENKNIDIIDINFYNKIYNKTIAVVGPASPLSENGEQIDRYDYIVRVNTLIGGKVPITLDKSKTGLRTDIIYYNDDMVNRWCDIIMSPENVHWNVFKNKKNCEKFINLSKNKSCSNQTTLDFLNGSTTAGAMMIPNILFDLLKYNPKKIKIFNVDFYLSGFNYMKGYKNYINKARNEKRFVKELRKHDAFFNYKLIKLFLNNKRIAIDKMGMIPLKMNSHDYASRLHKHFSKHTY